MTISATTEKSINRNMVSQSYFFESGQQMDDLVIHKVIEIKQRTSHHKATKTRHAFKVKIFTITTSDGDFLEIKCFDM